MISKKHIENILLDIQLKSINSNFYIDLNKNIVENFEKYTGPLRGLLFDLKLSFLTSDFKSDAASRILNGFVPCYNSYVYEEMINNGALFIGKTNCDEFSSGSLGVNSIYRPVFYNNMYTGGSSSGAAYTSKMFVDVAFGTDTGGSCRLPAMIVNNFSYKPSFGGISRFGVIEYSKSMDTIGSIFKDPENIMKVFNVLVQVDTRDSCTNLIPKIINKNLDLLILYKDKYTQNENKVLSCLRENFKNCDSDIEFNFNTLNALYDIKSCQDIFSECFKYDKLRYCNNIVHKKKDLDNFSYERYKLFGSHLIKKFVFGSMILSDEDIKNRYYFKCELVFQQIMLVMKNILSADSGKVLVFPSFFPDMDVTEAILKLANLSGLPSITIPINEKDFLNINANLRYNGIILIGYYGSDLSLLNIADIVNKKLYKEL